MRRTATTDELYFITLTIVDWIDVFTRIEYKDYIVKNLAFCQQQKGLELYAYVIMTNHIHLVARTAKGSRISDWLRDFKSFTSKGLYQLIKTSNTESRKDWILEKFQTHGQQNELNKAIQVWQNGSFPTCISMSDAHILQQKINYIHDNPVRAGFVSDAAEYVYSSANLQSPLQMNE